MHILQKLHALSLLDPDEYNLRGRFTLRELLQGALDNPKAIMELRWSRLLSAGVSVGVIDEVYDEGWECSVGTRELRGVFQRLITPNALNKSLEDYL